MHKKSGELLGTITENGFVRKKPKIDSKCFENISVLEMGATGYLWLKNQEMHENLKTLFPDYWKEIFAISVLRIVEGARFKRIEDAYETSCLSVISPGLNLSSSKLATILRTIGKRREAISEFMKKSSDNLSSYMIFDGHRIISDSETLDMAQMGYDSRRRFKDQINLVYAFSISGERCFPYYYKQFSGDVPDITAFSALVKEAGIEKKTLTVLADKGFASEDNFTLMEENGFSYIIPIKRNTDDSKNNIPYTISEYDDVFSFNGRAVLHKEKQMVGYTIHLYMDSSLFSNELSDMTIRLEKKNNTIEVRKKAEENRRKEGKARLSDEEFNMLQPIAFKEEYSNRTGLGTLALRTNNPQMNGAQIYYLYKRRQAIEEFFKTYDDSLDFSSSYMRDRYTEEAWLFLNHLSAIMAFSIIDEIYLKGRCKDISLKDFISVMSKIHADKVDDLWYCEKLTKKRADFSKSFDFDFSALIDVMNSTNSSD